LLHSNSHILTLILQEISRRHCWPAPHLMFPGIWAIPTGAVTKSKSSILKTSRSLNWPPTTTHPLPTSKATPRNKQSADTELAFILNDITNVFFFLLQFNLIFLLMNGQGVEPASDHSQRLWMPRLHPAAPATGCRMVQGLPVLELRRRGHRSK